MRKTAIVIGAVRYTYKAVQHVRSNPEPWATAANKFLGTIKAPWATAANMWIQQRLNTGERPDLSAAGYGTALQGRSNKNNLVIPGIVNEALASHNGADALYRWSMTPQLIARLAKEHSDQPATNSDQGRHRRKD
jgi:hypothetical protein